MAVVTTVQIPLCIEMPVRFIGPQIPSCSLYICTYRNIIEKVLKDSFMHQSPS